MKKRKDTFIINKKYSKEKILVKFKEEERELFKNINGLQKKGLSTEEVEKREKKYGKNVIPEKDRRNVLDLILSQFNDAFLLILFGAALIAFYMGDTTEALIIIAILIGSVLLGFYQEYKSENAIRGLRKYLSKKATVLRDGTKQLINVDDLVPGDLVYLEIGNIVPADVKLINVNDFSTDESTITGESKPANKKVEHDEENEFSNYALMGTTVVYGTAVGIVVKTGVNTYFGNVATLLSAKVPESEFQINLRKFSAFILKVIVIMTAVMFITNAWLGRGIFESLLFALALAVGVAPEMLPAITTIALSRGATNLANKKVVVKKLSTIEDLGNMNVLCMDKTGTLTEHKLELERGVNVNGEEDLKIIEHGLHCSHMHSHGMEFTGNIYDMAVLDYAEKNNIKKKIEYKTVDEIGFDFERKRMSEVFIYKNKRILISKGQPELIINVCTKMEINGKIVKINKQKVNEKLESLYKKGYNILAVASGEVDVKKEYTREDEKNLTFEGFLLFKSKAKKTASTAIAGLKDLHVSLYLLTGDDVNITEMLCKDVNLEIRGEKVISGKELDEWNDEELKNNVEKYNIYARVTPLQKVRIIEMLRENKHIVGFMGDGINDAPGLRLSNVGISVDTAQDIAMEAADIVLTQQNLDVVVEGVREGRRMFSNINKYILNTMSANYGSMVAVLISPLFIPFIPLLPVQILLTNFLSDIPLITITDDNVDEERVKKPQKWSIDLISKFMIYFGLISTIFDVITLVLFYYVLGLGAVMVRTLWFLESLLSEVFVTFIIRTELPFMRSKPNKLLVTSSIFIVIATLIIVGLPFIGEYFEFEVPSIENVLIVFAIVFAYCIATEWVKFWFFKRYNNV